MAQRECVSGGGMAQLACGETRASLSVTHTHTCAAPTAAASLPHTDGGGSLPLVSPGAPPLADWTGPVRGLLTSSFNPHGRAEAHRSNI